jgi:very-short-patch-repair endonuclease
LSVPIAILAAMDPDLPPQLRATVETQCGVLSCAQILDAGLTRGSLISRLRRASWQRMYPGVYATFSGEPNRLATPWAAILYAGPGATLSHQTAAELWRLADGPSSVIHVTVPGNRRVRRRAGMTVHLSSRASSAVHPARTPARTRLEETVIDLWETARDLDSAVGWVTTALGRRLTTQDKLRKAMEARSRIRRPKQLAELLGPDGTGIHSVLEYRYVHDVERAHGLAGAHRQARARRNGRNEYRDQLYAEYGVAIELDGRAAHPGDTRWKDIHRDNAAAAAGITTLRYGWLDVTTSPCQVAAEIAEVLRTRGYTAARPCSADCPVGRATTPDAISAVRPSQQTTAACTVPAEARPAQARPAQARPAQARRARARRRTPARSPRAAHAKAAR